MANTAVSGNPKDKALSIKMLWGYDPDFNSTEALPIQGEVAIC